MLILLYELYRIRPFVTAPLKVMLLSYLIIGLFGIGQLIHKNIRYGDLPEDYEALRQHIPDKERGLVPLTFFFNEYEEYGQLLTHENYKSHFAKQTHSPDQMAMWSENRDVDFILYDYKYLSEGYYPPPGQKSLPHYRLSFFDGRFAIYLQD